MLAKLLLLYLVITLCFLAGWYRLSMSSYVIDPSLPALAEERERYELWLRDKRICKVVLIVSGLLMLTLTLMLLL